MSPETFSTLPRGPVCENANVQLRWIRRWAVLQLLGAKFCVASDCTHVRTVQEIFRWIHIEPNQTEYFLRWECVCREPSCLCATHGKRQLCSGLILLTLSGVQAKDDLRSRARSMHQSLRRLASGVFWHAVLQWSWFHGLFGVFFLNPQRTLHCICCCLLYVFNRSLLSRHFIQIS